MLRSFSVNLRQLEYVIAIAETGSFTGAAVRCHTAQSALSYQVASLERELGTRLFDRTSRAVRITDAGRSLLPVARRTLRDLDAIRAELRGNGGSIRGPLRIGATQTGMRLFDLARIVEIRSQQPGLECSLILGPGWELSAGIAAGELDAVIAAVDDGVPEGTACVPLGHAEPLVAVMPAGHPCVTARYPAPHSRGIGPRRAAHPRPARARRPHAGGNNGRTRRHPRWEHAPCRRATSLRRVSPARFSAWVSLPTTTGLPGRQGSCG
jgi:DNA-binding transcriptional LysR family regulator